MQDVRGRYASDGEFRPYENEGRDGYDTIEWAAQQPWSNGRVGTFGLSYPGAVQWLAAVENPPHLEAMVPAMTFSTPQNFFYSGGIWDLSWMPWIWTSIAADARVRKRLPPATGEDRAQMERGERRRCSARCRSIGSRELRDIAPYHYDWLHHPPDDPFWNFAELRNKYGRTRAAVLNLSGWNDDNYGPEGAITNYLGLVAVAGRDNRRAPRSCSAPGSTASMRPRGRNSANAISGRAAAIDYDEVVLGWMDRYLRDDRRVRPVDGSAVFRHGRRTSGGRRTPGRLEGRDSMYYLSSAGDAPGRGGLAATPPAAAESPSTFVSDPDDPVINPYESAGVHDYQALAERSDVLTFDSAPLARDTDVTGPIRARVYVSCDCRDTDLWVRLLDVAPDGAAHNLMSPGAGRGARQLSRSRQGAAVADPGTACTRCSWITWSPAMSFCAGTGCGSRSPPRSFRTSRATSTPATSRRCRRAGNGRRSACITTASTRRRCRCMSSIDEIRARPSRA